MLICHAGNALKLKMNSMTRWATPQHISTNYAPAQIELALVAQYLTLIETKAIAFNSNY